MIIFVFFVCVCVALHQQKCDLGAARENKKEKKKQVSKMPMGMQFS